MAVDSQVQELLDELGDSGCTPEEVCAACPELLPEVDVDGVELDEVQAARPSVAARGRTTSAVRRALTARPHDGSSVDRGTTWQGSPHRAT